MTPTTPHVLIIGGGIAGPALALFLNKANISCALYETHAYSEGVGGGFAIAPNGMNVLAELGLAEQVIGRGSLALENVFRNERGRVLARLKNSDSKAGGPPAVSLSRSALYEVLAAEMRARGIAVQYQKRLASITDIAEQSQVVAHFADGTTADGDLLIGADGIHSAVRKNLLPEGPVPACVGILGLGGFVSTANIPSLTSGDQKSLNFTLGAKGFFGYCGGGPGQMMWWSNLPRDQGKKHEDLQAFSWPSTRQRLLEIYRGYHAPVESLINNTETPLHVNIHDIQSLPTWHRGRVLMIGDAAHAVSPNSGQGASMALEDAMYLAKLLRDSGSNFLAAIAQFERDRKPRVERIVAEGRRRAGNKKTVGPVQAKIRELMMSVFLNLFGIPGQDWMYRYRIDWQQ